MHKPGGDLGNKPSFQGDWAQGPEELQGGQCSGSRGSRKSEGLGAHQIELPGSFSGLLLLFLVIWRGTEGLCVGE